MIALIEKLAAHGRYRFEELVSLQSAPDTLATFERGIADNARADANLGIEIVDTGILRRRHRMSPFRPILPWLLLALSLAANARLLFRLRAPETPPAEFVTHPVTNPRAPEGGNVTGLVTLSLSPTSPDTNASPSAPESAPPPSTRPAASPSATYAAYADLLALSLETPAQHDELARVLGRWIASDPASASEWLNRQPDDPRLDLPVSQVAVHLTARGDYALAREWADSIRTPEVRLAAIEEILAEQYRHHRLTPAALADAATRAGLPPDRVHGILNYSRLD